MNALIKGEYDKLTSIQQKTFRELAGWQTAHNKGQSIMSDGAYFKILEWVKNIQEPVEELVKEEPET